MKTIETAALTRPRTASASVLANPEPGFVNTGAEFGEVGSAHRLGRAPYMTFGYLTRAEPLAGPTFLRLIALTETCRVLVAELNYVPVIVELSGDWDTASTLPPPRGRGGSAPGPPRPYRPLQAGDSAPRARGDSGRAGAGS